MIPKALSNRNWRAPFSLLVVISFLTGLVFPVMNSPAPVVAKPLAPQAEVVATYDFEDGTQGWYGRGAASVSVVSDVVHTGTQALQVTGRTDGWHGPALNVLNMLEADATYEISACVRMEAATPSAHVMMKVAYTPAGGTETYPGIVEADVTNSDWTCVHGSFSFADEASGLTLYVESTDTTASYYIDDVEIAMTAAAPLPVIASYDFEDGAQGWEPRGGGVSVTVVSDTVHTGEQALLVTGRTSNWHGVSRSVLSLLELGATYEISGCVQLAAGTAVTQAQITMQTRLVGASDDTYTSIVNEAVNDSGWVCMHGPYTYAEEASALTLYVEVADPTASFYVDDLLIVMTAEAPTTEVNLVTDFETGTTEGWKSRSGAEVVTTTTEIAHGGSYSLKTTGRTINWHAPALNIRDVVTVGVQYDVAVWARLLPDEPAADIKVSVELKPAGVPTSTYKTVINNTAATTTSWTLLAGTYILDQEVDFLEIYVESPMTVSFYIDDFSLRYINKPPVQMDIPSVYETYAGDFIVGAALETDGVQSPRHEQLLQRHFNSITAGNAMKPGPIHPISDTYNFGPADTIANYARDNDMYLHGHTLVWHSQAAEWMFETDAGEPLTPTLANKALVLSRMEDHIRTVVRRYGDVVNVWDVVNEVVDPAQPDCYRRSTWYELTGPDYITRAFQIAHEEAPTATLILNDYGETGITKRECMYNLVKNLQDQGVAVGGIGMQMHIDIQSPSVSEMEAAIQRFAELGEVHITELDMSIYPNDIDSYTTVPESVLIRQGHRYKDIFAMLRKYGAAGTGDLKSVTFWGMADDATWLSTFPIPRLEMPLLFDTNLQAKYAYWGIIDPSRLPVNIQEQNSFMGSPVLDGTIDPLWTYVPWVEIPSNGTISATFQTRWDQDYLYVVADVVDATADAGDKIEVFVDQNDDNATSYQGDDRHYTYPNETGQMDYVVITNTHGYQLEARLPLTVAFAINTSFGFDIRVTDGSHPSDPISWNDPTHSQNTNPSQFGRLILVDEMRVTTALPGTPVIDAVADDLWADAATISTDLWALGNNGATATVKTLWDSNHLYVFAVVSDSLLSKVSANAYEEDSIEVFLDQNNGKTSSYQSDDGQYRVNFDNEHSFGGSTVTTTLTSAAMTATWGYTVELAITLTDVLPQDGVVVGFDFQVNDANAAGARTSIAKWNDPTDGSWQNLSRLGVLEFVERSAPENFRIYLPLVLRGSGTN